MGIKKTYGFTIIEVILFLAVTGALTIAILAGAGVQINQQRYRDSVSSLKSFLQAQYSEVTNVINDRGNNWQCNTNGTVDEVANGGSSRGTTDCVILGRLVTVDATGTQLTASNIVGYKSPSAPVATSDITELENYALSVTTINQETDEVSWGARIVNPQNLANPQSLSILIVRSPLSGAVLTFTTEGVSQDVGGMIEQPNMQQRDLCVDPSAGSLVGQRLAVRIAAFASNQSAIETPAASGEGAPCQG